MKSTLAGHNVVKHFLNLNSRRGLCTVTKHVLRVLLKIHKILATSGCQFLPNCLDSLHGLIMVCVSSARLL